MRTSRLILILIFAAFLGGVIGSGFTMTYLKSGQKTKKQLMAEFYQVENAVHVSPHSIRKRMDKGEKNYILVDVRSRQEYEKSHIVGAFNVPAYKDPDTSISLDTELEEKKRIVEAFKALPKDKEIIVYCYSIPCMTGRKIGLLLSDNDIFVKVLGIGWNEWRYYWALWNHDGEIPSQVEDYIISGKEPGIPKIKQVPSPCTQGELGC